VPACWEEDKDESVQLEEPMTPFENEKEKEKPPQEDIFEVSNEVAPTVVFSVDSFEMPCLEDYEPAEDESDFSTSSEEEPPSDDSTQSVEVSLDSSSFTMLEIPVILHEVVEVEEVEEDEKPVCLIAVKLYFSSEDIRRIALNKNDPSAFDKLAAGVSRINPEGRVAVFRPKYIDDEREHVSMRSQEEFEECIRVHETSIWPNEGRTTPILRLYL